MEDWGSWTDEAPSVKSTSKAPSRQPSTLSKKIGAAAGALTTSSAATDDWESLLNDSGQAQHTGRSFNPSLLLPGTSRTPPGATPSAAQSARNLAPGPAADPPDASAKSNTSLTGAQRTMVKTMPPPFKRPLPSARHALLTAGKPSPMSDGMLAAKPSQRVTEDGIKPRAPSAAAALKAEQAASSTSAATAPAQPSIKQAFAGGRPASEAAGGAKLMLGSPAVHDTVAKPAAHLSILTRPAPPFLPTHLKASQAPLPASAACPGAAAPPSAASAAPASAAAAAASAPAASASAAAARLKSYQGRSAAGLLAAKPRAVTPDASAAVPSSAQAAAQAAPAAQPQSDAPPSKPVLAGSARAGSLLNEQQASGTVRLARQVTSAGTGSRRSVPPAGSVGIDVAEGGQLQAKPAASELPFGTAMAPAPVMPVKPGQSKRHAAEVLTEDTSVPPTRTVASPPIKRTNASTPVAVAKQPPSTSPQLPLNLPAPVLVPEADLYQPQAAASMQALARDSQAPEVEAGSTNLGNVESQPKSATFTSDHNAPASGALSAVENRRQHKGGQVPKSTAGSTQLGSIATHNKNARFSSVQDASASTVTSSSAVEDGQQHTSSQVPESAAGSTHLGSVFSQPKVATFSSHQSDSASAAAFSSSVEDSQQLRGTNMAALTSAMAAPAIASAATAGLSASADSSTAGLQLSMPSIPFAAFGKTSPDDDDDFFGETAGNAGLAAVADFGQSNTDPLGLYEDTDAVQISSIAGASLTADPLDLFAEDAVEVPESNVAPVTPHAPIVSSQLSQELPSFHDWAHSPSRSPPGTPTTAPTPVAFPPLPADMPSPSPLSTNAAATSSLFETKASTDQCDAHAPKGHAAAPALQPKQQLTQAGTKGHQPGLPPRAADVRLTAQKQQSSTASALQATSSQLPVQASETSLLHLPVQEDKIQLGTASGSGHALTHTHVLPKDDKGNLAGTKTEAAVAEPVAQTAAKQQPDAGDKHKPPELQEQGLASQNSQLQAHELRDDRGGVQSHGGGQAQPFSIPFSGMAAAFRDATNDEDDFFGSPSKEQQAPSANRLQDSAQACWRDSAAPANELGDSDQPFWEDSTAPKASMDLSLLHRLEGHANTFPQPQSQVEPFPAAVTLFTQPVPQQQEVFPLQRGPHHQSQVEPFPAAITPFTQPAHQQQEVLFLQRGAHQHQAAQQDSNPPSDTAHRTSASALPAPAQHSDKHAMAQSPPTYNEHLPHPFSQSSASVLFPSPAQLPSQPQSLPEPSQPQTQTHWPGAHTEPLLSGLQQKSPTALPVHALAIKTQAVASPLSPGPLQPASGGHAQQPFATADQASSAGQMQTQSVWSIQGSNQAPSYPDPFANAHQQPHPIQPDLAADQDQDQWLQPGNEQQNLWAQHDQQNIWAQQASHAQHEPVKEEFWAQQAQHEPDQQMVWAQHAQQGDNQQALYAQQAQHGFDQRSLWAPQPAAQQSRPVRWANTRAPAASPRYQAQHFHPHQHQTTVSSPFAPSPQSVQLFTPFATAQPAAQSSFAPSYPPAPHPFGSAQPSQPSFPAAFASPWDATAGAHGAAAVLDEQYLDEDSSHRSLDGRPACALLAFGFAGKLYLWQPQHAQGFTATAAEDSSLSAAPTCGQLCVLSWPSASTQLAAVQHQQCALSRQLPPAPSEHAALSQFPGPLVPGSNKDKVFKFIEAALEGQEQQGAFCQEPVELRMLWQILQLVCQHKGELRSPDTAAAAASDKRSEAALAAILAPKKDQQQEQNAAASPHSPWGDAAALGMGMGMPQSSVLQPQPGAGQLEVAAKEMQALLMAGQRLQALKVATAGKLWGPALLLARHCGDKAFVETAAAMAESSTVAGSPLNSIALIMSGKADAMHAAPAQPPDQADAAAEAMAVAVNPAPGPIAVLDQWRENLAIMAGSHLPGAEAAMAKLGDRLWQERSQVMAAHLCFVLAGVHPAPFDPSSQLCLPGGNHRGQPRCYASVAAMQRLQLLEWARSQGQPSYSLQHMIALLPYKLLYASHLAEHGFISEAAQHCGVVQQGLAGVPKLPPGLAVCRSFTQDLLDRLQTYAAAHSIPLQMSRAGSVLSISGMGRWLDKGLSKLMGGPEASPSTRPPSTASPVSDFNPYMAKHRRNTSDQLLAADAPKVTAPKRSQSSQDMLQQPFPSPAKPNPSFPSTPERNGPQSPPQPQPQLQPQVHSSQSEQLEHKSLKGQGSTAAEVAPAKGGAPGWGLMGRVASGLLGSGAKKAPADKKGPTQAKLGDENAFYFDEETKQWRERGVEAVAPSVPPPPPPKSSLPPAGSIDLPAGLTRQASSGPPGAAGRPPLPAPPAPAVLIRQPSSGAPSSLLPRTGVRSRYVANFNTGNTATPTATVPTLSLVPPRPLGPASRVARPVVLFNPQTQAQSLSAAASAAPAEVSRQAAPGVTSATSSASDHADAADESLTRTNPIEDKVAGQGRAGLNSKAVPGAQGRAAVRARAGGAPVYTRAGEAAVAAFGQKGTKATSVDTRQQGALPAKSSVGSAAQAATQDAGVATRQTSSGSQEQHAFPSADAGSAADVVTTYSSFTHDTHQSYAAVSSGLSIMAPTVSSALFGAVGQQTQRSGAQFTGADAVASAEPLDANSFDDMTELQL